MPLAFQTMETGYLFVQLDTPRLILTPITRQNLSEYLSLLGSQENMEHYATGTPWDEERIESRVKAWSLRWQQGNPFSSFVVRLKSTNEMIGHIILTFGDKSGSAELAYVLHKRFWHLGYGKEMLTHFVSDYLPALILRDYRINGHEFAELLATSIPENTYSIRLLQSIGMQKIGEEFSYGHNKLIFFKTCKNIIESSDANDLYKTHCFAG